MAKASRLQRANEGSVPASEWGYLHTPLGGFREADPNPGRYHLAPDSVEKLKERGFTNDEIYKIVAPRRTLARRKERGENLSVVETDRVLRLERIADMADRVFASHDKAQRWLRSKIIALDGVRPIDLLETETGAHVVEQELHRIDFGMLA